MLKKLLKSPGLIVFFLSTIIILFGRSINQSFIYMVFVPFMTLSLMFDYYKKVENQDQTLYFILVFCLLGDLIITLEGFYAYTSGLMAYWGASILFYFSLYKELKKPLGELLKTTKFILPFSIYGIYFIVLMIYIQPFLADLFVPILIYAATLSFTVALSFVVYFHNKTKPNQYFMIGLFILSITASLMGLNRFVFKNNLLHVIETLLYVPSLFYIYLYFKTKIKSEDKKIMY